MHAVAISHTLRRVGWAHTFLTPGPAFFLLQVKTHSPEGLRPAPGSCGSEGLQSEREAGRSEAGLTRSPMRLHLDGPSTHSLKRSSGERQRRQNPDTAHTSLCCYNTTSCEHSDSKLLPTEQACSPLGRFLWLSWEQLVFMTEELSVNTYPFC